MEQKLILLNQNNWLELPKNIRIIWITKFKSRLIDNDKIQIRWIIMEYEPKTKLYNFMEQKIDYNNSI